MHPNLDTANSDTIASLATPPGKGALSVVRVSGNGVRNLVTLCCKNPEQILNNPRMQIYTGFGAESIIDYPLISFFPGPKSFTGEDVLELSLHGSSVIVREVLRLIYSHNIRPAEPGEFTKRAFLNGKLDLAQAEAVADLISSETEAQARLAREQLEGKLSNVITNLAEPLRNLLAEIEAYIDFPDEDITPDTVDKWLLVLNSRREKISKYINSFSSGRMLREGISIALSGIPNAGKSSLMNYLLGEERAIVTNLPGTTRDSIEEKLELNGVLFRLWDTAGIVDEESFKEFDNDKRTIELPEQMGIERSWKLVELSDIVLFLFDLESDINLQLKLLEKISSKNSKVLILFSKADKNFENKLDIEKKLSSYKTFSVSSKTGEGVSELINYITEHLVGNVSNEDIRIANERHYLMLKSSFQKIDLAISAIKTNEASEYISFEVRQALIDLQDIVGVTSTEDILGRIFSKFCIGK